MLKRLFKKKPKTESNVSLTNIPGLGKVVMDSRFNWFVSEPISVPVLEGKICRIIVEDYEDDPAKEEFHVAIKNFLSIDQSVLIEAESFIFQYYKDYNADFEPEEDGFLVIESPEEVWDYIQLGGQPCVTRRAHGDRGVYVSLECNCDWEEEHGLQIVFQNGLRVNKVGPYDGHLTNSDAYDQDNLEHVVYQERFSST